jgi:hypothetical protein
MVRMLAGAILHETTRPQMSRGGLVYLNEHQCSPFSAGAVQRFWQVCAWCPAQQVRKTPHRDCARNNLLLPRCIRSIHAHSHSGITEHSSDLTIFIHRSFPTPQQSLTLPIQDITIRSQCAKARLESSLTNPPWDTMKARVCLRYFSERSFYHATIAYAACCRWSRDHHHHG